jgi:hypothetical protein
MKINCSFWLAMAFIFISSAHTSFGAPTLLFGTIPATGSISGSAGTTIGWGYTLTNQDSALWFSADSLNTSAAFSNGVFDTNNFDSPVVAPGQTVTEAFLATTAGLAELTWNAGAPANAQDSGLFQLSVTWYTEDPNLCGFACVYTGTAQGSASTPYSASVVAPEPASAETVGCTCLIGLMVWRAWHVYRRQ